MLKRRVPRAAVSGLLLAVAVSGLAACRTSPSVAAYVGNEQISVSELESAVEDRLSDPLVATYAQGRRDEFVRDVLERLVQEEVHAAAAERYDVRVTDDEVRARIDELLGEDAEEVVVQLAQQGYGRADIVENVRQQLVRREIAEAEGDADALSEQALRARYEEVREELAQISFGYITVPDEATAQAVIAGLTADPASYPAVAAQYPGAATLPELEAHPPGDLPGVLAEGIESAEPNTAFATPVPQVDGVVVTFVEGVVYPSFEEVRPQLERAAAQTAQAAGEERIQDVREDLGVTVNPRYGPRDGGVVDLLDDEDEAAAPAE